MRKFGVWFVLVVMILALNACKTQPIATHTKALKDLSKAAHINVQLGIAYLHQGDTVRAKQKLLLAEQQAPSADTERALAYFYAQTGNLPQANQYYQKALRRSPDDGATHNNYGVFLCRQKKYQLAEQQFLRAINIPRYVNTADAYENAGLCALLIPDYTKAKAYFEAALQSNPNLPVSLQQLIRLNYTQQQYQQANGYLQRYIKVGQITPNILWLGVQIAQKLNDNVKMQQYGRLLKSRFPHSAQFAQYQQLTQVRSNDR